MSRRIGRLDRALMRRSARTRTPRRDRALVAVSRAADYSRIWLVIAGALALFGGASGRRAARDGLLAIAIGASVANGPAKLLVRRRRPADDGGSALIAMPVSSSFPSGHSAAAFAFLTGAAGELPALAPALAPMAGAVAYSRVHTGVHYPSDVLAGAAIGIGSGVIARHLAEGRRPGPTRRGGGGAGR